MGDEAEGHHDSVVVVVVGGGGGGGGWLVGWLVNLTHVCGAAGKYRLHSMASLVTVFGTREYHV